MREISKIYIHHSAMPENKGVRAIRKLHLERGFDDIGYHFVIDRYGKIRKGRDIEKEGAHVKTDNTHSIGICLCGNFEEKIPYPSQIKTLEKLIVQLYKRFGKLEIWGHKDYPAANTSCPGKYLYKLIPEIRKRVQESRSSGVSESNSLTLKPSNSLTL